MAKVQSCNDIILDRRNPSTADVIDAFARAWEDSPKTLMFFCGEHLCVYITITSLEYESAKPGMFSFKGHFGGESMQGFYDSNERRGYINRWK